MDEYLDFFNIYIIGLIEGGFQFYFLAIKSSLLYAALTTEIMLLCYGIVKSLIGLLYAWMPVWKNISVCPDVSRETSL